MYFLSYVIFLEISLSSLISSTMSNIDLRPNSKEGLVAYPVVRIRKNNPLLVQSARKGCKYYASKLEIYEPSPLLYQFAKFSFELTMDYCKMPVICDF